jgi:hypothetical protein
MKVMKKYQYCSLVFLRKGENFPGTTGMPQKQGYYFLWTGANYSDYRQSEYLGVILPHPDYFESRGL